MENEDSTDFWNELTSEQRNEIKVASLEIEKGDVVEYEDFIKEQKNKKNIN